MSMSIMTTQTGSIAEYIFICVTYGGNKNILFICKDRNYV